MRGALDDAVMHKASVSIDIRFDGANKKTQKNAHENGMLLSPWYARMSFAVEWHASVAYACIDVDRSRMAWLFRDCVWRCHLQSILCPARYHVYGFWFCRGWVQRLQYRPLMQAVIVPCKTICVCVLQLLYLNGLPCISTFDFSIHWALPLSCMTSVHARAIHFVITWCAMILRHHQALSNIVRARANSVMITSVMDYSQFFCFHFYQLSTATNRWEGAAFVVSACTAGNFSRRGVLQNLCVRTLFLSRFRLLFQSLSSRALQDIVRASACYLTCALPHCFAAPKGTYKREMHRIPYSHLHCPPTYCFLCWRERRVPCCLRCEDKEPCVTVRKMGRMRGENGSELQLPIYWDEPYRTSHRQKFWNSPHNKRQYRSSKKPTCCGEKHGLFLAWLKEKEIEERCAQRSKQDGQEDQGDQGGIQTIQVNKHIFVFSQIHEEGCQSKTWEWADHDDTTRCNPIFITTHESPWVVRV